jgi:hypothetical protein
MKVEGTKILFNGTYNIANHPNEFLYKNKNKINLSVFLFLLITKHDLQKKKIMFSHTKKDCAFVDCDSDEKFPNVLLV